MPRLKEVDWSSSETLVDVCSIGIEPLIFMIGQVYELANNGPIYEEGREESELLRFFVNQLENQVQDLKDCLMRLNVEGGVRIPGNIYRIADEVARRRGTSIERLFSEYFDKLMNGQESFLKKEGAEHETA